MHREYRCPGWICLLVLFSPALALAQGLPVLGARAAGFGAFVAVADDASAAAWNPAGLVNGPIFNVLLDLGRSTSEPSFADTSRQRAGETDAFVLAFGVPPLGLTYYRLHSVTAERAAAQPAPGRQDRQVAVRSLVTTHIGATVLQSLADGLTVGATVKLVRGRLAADVIDTASWAAALDRADVLEGNGRTTGDADVGVLYAVGRLRAGAVFRNIRAPRFEAAASPTAVTLDRHVRAGVAWGDRWPGLPATVVAVDADFTRVEHAGGARRDIAAGVERWWAAQRFAVRGGVRASTLGDPRAIATVGGSLAVRQGLYVDGYAAGGAADDRGWGIGARLTY